METHRRMEETSCDDNGHGGDNEGKDLSSLKNSHDEADPHPVETFHNQGFLRLQSLLSPNTSKQLRTFILKDLDETLRSDADEHEKRFSNIRERSHRWDLKLKMSPIVHAAMAEILQSRQPCGDKQEKNSNNDHGSDCLLRSILAPLCQCAQHPEDLILAELGTLVSEPGAQHQQWHADTAHTGPEEPDCICCFVTLQETPVSMGPTQLIPYTHMADFHQSALCNFPPKGLMPTTVEPKSMQAGYKSPGEALLMDCRLYHRGSANTHQPTEGDENDDGKRVIFYFTVRSEKAPKPKGFLFTIMEELNGMPLVEFLEDA